MKLTSVLLAALYLFSPQFAHAELDYPIFQPAGRPAPLETSLQVQDQAVFRLHSRGVPPCPDGSCPLVPPALQPRVSLLGSCVLIHQSEEGICYFLTAGHVLASDNQVEIDNQRYPVLILGSSKVYGGDTAVLIRTTTPVPLSLKGYRLSTTPPEIGDTVYLIGYPQGRRGQIKTIIDSVTSDGFETRRGLIQGASGGACINDEGEILGYIHYIDPQRGSQLLSRGDRICSSLIRSSWAVTLGLRPPESSTPSPAEPSAPQLAQEPPPPSAAPQQPVAPSESSPTPSEPSTPTSPQSSTPATPAPPQLSNPAIPTSPQPPQESAPSLFSRALDWAGEIPWFSILSLAGVGATGVGGVAGLGWLALKAGSLLLRKGAGVSRRQSTFRQSRSELPPRDLTEAQQILSVRRQEQRQPVLDALYGVFLQDEYRTNPDQPFRQAWESATTRFNQAAPLSLQEIEVAEERSSSP